MRHTWDPRQEDWEHRPWTFETYVQLTSRPNLSWIIWGLDNEMHIIGNDDMRVAQFSSRRVRR